MRTVLMTPTKSLRRSVEEEADSVRAYTWARGVGAHDPVAHAVLSTVSAPPCLADVPVDQWFGTWLVDGAGRLRTVVWSVPSAGVVLAADESGSVDRVPVNAATCLVRVPRLVPSAGLVDDGVKLVVPVSVRFDQLRWVWCFTDDTGPALYVSSVGGDTAVIADDKGMRDVDRAKVTVVVTGVSVWESVVSGGVVVPKPVVDAAVVERAMDRVESSSASSPGEEAAFGYVRWLSGVR